VVKQEFDKETWARPGRQGDKEIPVLPLLVLIGPTAVGKTALSLQLAKQFNGEIVSADSRLFYLGMNIGTAKPTPAERGEVVHHLIDICRPDATLTLGEYQRLAYHAIEDIQRRGRLPILVGGTGQYVKAVVEGWGIPEVPPQLALREALANLGSAEVTRWLRALDPAAAERIDPRNVRRVIRALEVTLSSGRPISELQRKTPPPYTICTIGLTCDRETLYRRVDERVDGMMAAGLLEEVKALREDGYGRDLPSMSGLGYQQLQAHLDGELTLPEAIERIKFETHRFVRQQYTWFRLDDPAVHWFDNCAGETGPAVAQLVTTWLATE
jgi:tRNA dimethylallyltransferase